MKSKKLFTIHQKLRSEKRINHLESKLKRLRKIDFQNMNEIRRLRELLDEHNIQWSEKMSIEITPFKKE